MTSYTKSFMAPITVKQAPPWHIQENLVTRSKQPCTGSVPGTPAESLLLFRSGPGLQEWMGMVLAQKDHRLAREADSWTIDYADDYMAPSSSQRACLDFEKALFPYTSVKRAYKPLCSLSAGHKEHIEESCLNHFLKNN